MELADLLFWKKKEAREIIIEAESIAAETGSRVGLVLEEVLKKVKNPFIKKAYLKLERGLPKYEAYKGIFPKDFILLLRETEKVSLVSRVFQDYSKVLKKIDEAEANFKKAFIQPTVMTFLYLTVAFYILNIFSERVADSIGGDFSAAIQGARVFLYLIPIFITFVFSFFFVPFLRKFNPVVKKIDDFLTLVKLLSLFGVCVETGISTYNLLKMYGEIFPQFRSLKNLPPEKASVEKVAEIIGKYTTPIEAVFIVLSVRAGSDKAVEYLSFLYRRKMEQFDFTVKESLTGIKTLLSFVSYLPILPVAFVISKLLTSMTSMMNGGGGF